MKVQRRKEKRLRQGSWRWHGNDKGETDGKRCQRKEGDRGNRGEIRERDTMNPEIKRRIDKGAQGGMKAKENKKAEQDRTDSDGRFSCWRGLMELERRRKRPKRAKSFRPVGEVKLCIS
jgi:hypothetical protein